MRSRLRGRGAALAFAPPFALVATAALLGTACTKPVAGAACKKEGQRACESDSKALVCVGAKWEELPCRGAGGCKSAGDDVSCENQTNLAGEPCDIGDDGYECTVDKTSVIQCKGKHWKVVGKCPGPNACTSDKQKVKCDDSVADVGMACAFDNTFACSADKKLLLHCKSGAMVEDSKCRDTTIAEAGDSCITEDESACSVDSSHMLKCRSGTMAAVQTCKGGCKLVGTEVHCN
jgi:hypothetical protein